MTNFLIYGAGGHGQTIAWIVQNSYPDYRELFFVETREYFDANVHPRIVNGVKVLQGDNELDVEKFKGIIGVGQIRSSLARRSIHDHLLQKGVEMPAIFSSSAQVSDSVRVESAAQIMSNTVIGPDVFIGTGTAVNNGAQIEHGTRVGNFCHISTGAIINGQVDIGDDVFIGSGAVVRNGVSIAQGSFVPMGTLVTRDVTK